MTSPAGSIRLIPGNLKLNDVLYDFLCKEEMKTLVMVVLYNDQVKNFSCREEKVDPNL